MDSIGPQLYLNESSVYSFGSTYDFILFLIFLPFLFISLGIGEEEIVIHLYFSFTSLTQLY